MHIRLGEFQTVRCLFRFVNDFFDTVDNFTLAGRPALMNAIVFIGVKFASNMEYTDFKSTLRDNFTIAVFEFLGSADVQIRHLCSSSVTH